MMLQITASLTAYYRGVIYDRNILIIQATDCKQIMPLFRGKASWAKNHTTKQLNKAAELNNLSRDIFECLLELNLR
jgi:hypothetical protein